MGAVLAKILAVVALWTTGIITALGLPGIAFLMAICAACIPLPSELVLPFAGYLAGQGHFTLLGIAIAGAIGENIGAGLAFTVGQRGGRAFVARYGRYLLLDLHHLDQAERFFARFGRAAVLFGRMLPLVRAFVALPAGLARMPRAQFHLYTTIGSFIWCYALAWVGLHLGRAWDTDPRIKAFFHDFDLALVAVAALAFAYLLWLKFRPRSDKA